MVRTGDNCTRKRAWTSVKLGSGVVEDMEKTILEVLQVSLRPSRPRLAVYSTYTAKRGREMVLSVARPKDGKKAAQRGLFCGFFNVHHRSFFIEFYGGEGAAVGKLGGLNGSRPSRPGGQISRPRGARWWWGGWAGGKEGNLNFCSIKKGKPEHAALDFWP